MLMRPAYRLSGSKRYIQLDLYGVASAKLFHVKNARSEDFSVGRT